MSLEKQKVQSFESFHSKPVEVNEAESAHYSMVGIDISTDIAEKTDDFLQLLQEITEQFELDIIGLWPMGPGGGHPEVTFRGTAENIKKMITDWYMADDKDDAEEWIKDYVSPYSPTDHEVKHDERFKLTRKFIKTDGSPME